MRTQAWKDGCEAFQCGDDESDNPYEPDTPESKEWCDGFKQAQDDEAKEDDTHGSPELDEDAAKLRAQGQDPGPTLAIFRKEE